jgi:hypothetical protein
MGNANAGTVLVPPGVAKPDLARRSFTTNIAAGPKACKADGDALRATRRGKWLHIAVDRNALAAQPQGWLWNWTAEAESQGCIVPGEGLRLLSRIVESVPLDSRVAYRLLRAKASLSSMEIGTESRLQVITPIMRDGAAPDAPLIETTRVSGSDDTINVDVKAAHSLLGYETAWYRVGPKTGGIGFKLIPISVERTIQGSTESAAAPIVNYLRFPSEANFYRLFLKADLENHPITQMVIAAPTRAELDRRTKAIDIDPSLCAASDGQCVAIPRRAAINVWTAVWVNGTEVKVLGGTIRSAIEAAGEKDAVRVLPRLTVQRPYGGDLALVEFDRSSTGILDVVLIGGEKISW